MVKKCTVKLTREVRFSLTSDFEEQIAPAKAINSWGGWPGSLSAAPFLAVRVTVAGVPDPVTGMLCNISAIDAAVRTAGFQALAELTDWDASVLLSRLASAVVEALAASPQPRESQTESSESGTPESGAVATLSESTTEISITDVELLLTPTARLEMSIQNPDRVLLTQQFEFAAAHRLHCDDYSEEENRRVFGKCNNPGGHGHNYILEITLATTPDDLQGRVISLAEFEATVRREVIDPYDHEHLNCEDDFAGMNPTVENIAKVIWKKLHGKFGPAQLHRVRVHETSKTMAEYGGE